MKKTLSLAIVLMLASLFIVSAAELDVVEAGSLPGDFSYGIDKAIDNFRYSITFNKEKKAVLALQIAEERAAEIRALALEKKLDRIEQAKSSYEKYVEKSRKVLDEIEISDDEKKSEETIRELSRIKDRVESHQERLQELKLSVLEQAGEDLSEEEVQKIEEFFEKLQDDTNLVGASAIKRLENAQSSYKLLKKISDDELEDELEKIREEEGLSENQKERIEKANERIKKEIELRKELLEKRREKIEENKDLTEEQKQVALEQIQIQQDRLSEAEKVRELAKELAESGDIEAAKNIIKEEYRKIVSEREEIDPELVMKLRERYENSKKIGFVNKDLDKDALEKRKELLEKINEKKGLKEMDDDLEDDLKDIEDSIKEDSKDLEDELKDLEDSMEDLSSKM